MKIHTLRNRLFLPALSCVALAITSDSQAAVTVYFEQVDSNVVATWTGSIDLWQWLTDDSAFFAVAGSERLALVIGDYDLYGVGTAENTSLSGTVGSYTGSYGGFVGSDFYVEGIDDGGVPASSVYDYDLVPMSHIFGNQTLSGIGADSFNNTLAWTSNNGGTNTVSYTTVGIPEPSSTALLSLGILALVVRRHR